MIRACRFVLTWTLVASLATPVPAQVDLKDRMSVTEIGEEEEGSPQAEANIIEEVLPEALEGPIDPDTYVLGPLDELFLILRGPDTQLQHLRVLPEGTVILPNVGSFPAAGMTLTEFRSRVRETLQRYYRNIKIDCVLSRPRTFVVYILGSVRRAGAVEMHAPFRVSRALLAGGGVDDKGSLREIEIREHGEVVSVVDLFSFLRFGDLAQNPTLQEGQSVYVPAKRTTVTITGEVRLGGMYEMLPGETVGDLLRYAGGFTSRADRAGIELERTRGLDEEIGLTFPDERAGEIELKDLDIVVVRDLLSYDGREPVRVIGGGGRTGAIFIEDGVTLRAFLPRLGRFTPEFDTENAILERYGSEDEPELIRFSVREVMNGGAEGETVLLPGDLVSFPRVEGQVFVAGEVVQPGPVAYQPGLPAERYVALAGGPNEQGSFDKIKILSLDGRKRGGNRSSLVYRGETIVVGRSTARVFGSLLLGFVSLTSLALSVVAVVRSTN